MLTAIDTQLSALHQGIQSIHNADNNAIQVDSVLIEWNSKDTCHPLSVIIGNTPFYFASSYALPMSVQESCHGRRVLSCELGTTSITSFSILDSIDNGKKNRIQLVDLNDKEPCPMIEARKLMGDYYSLVNDPKYDKDAPLIVFAKEMNHFVFIGSHPKKTRLLQRPPFMIYSYPNTFYVPESNNKERPQEGRELSTYKEMMSCFVKQQQGISQDQVETRAAACYEILPKSAYRSVSCQISMHFTWKECTEILHSPSFDSDIHLNIHYVDGTIDPENHESSNYLKRQLSTLSMWNQVFSNQCEWNELQGECQSHLFEEFLLDVQDMCRNTSSRDTPPLQNESISFLDGPIKRKDYDFTDLFIEYAFKAKNLEDLKSIMTGIVEEIETQRLKPLIHKNNSTRFASTIREWMILSLLTTCKDADEKKAKLHSVFDKWIHSPLECLIELGIDKLYRDLVYHFVSSNLAQFSQFTCFRNSSDPLTRQIENLYSILSVLELTLLVSSHILSLPHDTHRQLIENALEIQKQTHELEMIFTIPLSRFSTQVSKLVHAVTNSFEFKSWSLLFTNTKSNSKEMHYLSRESLVKLETQDEQTIDMDGRWFYTRALAYE